MASSGREYRRNSSFFFPVALITVGVVWLLVNRGVIPIENIYRVLPYWPVLLILWGVSILVRRIWWPINLLIWGLAAALLVAALIYPPPFLAQTAPVAYHHQVLTEPLGQAKSADATLRLSVYPARIHALDGSRDLIRADVYSTGTPSLAVTGEARKQLTLSAGQSDFPWWQFSQYVTPSSNPWDIGLAKAIPFDLSVDASTGEATLDLTGLTLSSLTVSASTGSMDITLPENQKISAVKVNCSTGRIQITVPRGTSGAMTVNASTGDLSINLPANAGAQVTITSSGPGSLNLPGFKKVRGPVESSNKEGVYENAAYAGSEAPILLTIDLGTGSVSVQ